MAPGRASGPSRPLGEFDEGGKYSALASGCFEAGAGDMGETSDSGLGDGLGELMIGSMSSLSALGSLTVARV